MCSSLKSTIQPNYGTRPTLSLGDGDGADERTLGYLT